jgi:hypothetical protein
MRAVHLVDALSQAHMAMERRNDAGDALKPLPTPPRAGITIASHIASAFGTAKPVARALRPC